LRSGCEARSTELHPGGATGGVGRRLGRAKKSSSSSEPSEDDPDSEWRKDGEEGEAERSERIGKFFRSAVTELPTAVRWRHRGHGSTAPGAAASMRVRHARQKPWPQWRSSGTCSSSSYRTWHSEQHGTRIAPAASVGSALGRGVGGTGKAMRGRSGRGFGKGDECELEDFLRGIVEGVGGADW
jgi:hypothetical protein